ncbi:hypothetical protein QQ045_032069 [Rhodiola kirilowii]
MDGYIPAKWRSATRSRFGFIRFLTKEEAWLAIARWDEVKVAGEILSVKMADHDKRNHQPPVEAKEGDRKRAASNTEAKKEWRPVEKSEGHG